MLSIAVGVKTRQIISGSTPPQLRAASNKQQGFDRDPVTEGMNGTEAVPGWGRNRVNLRSILTLNSRVAFYDWPICPTTRSTA